MSKPKTREPLFHIAKRDAIPGLNAWLIRILSVAVALILIGVVTVIVTDVKNPLDVYITMISGSFSKPRRIWKLLQSLSMLLCVALAITPAFKMRFWNCGGEGQVLVGGLATLACMILLGDKVPSALLIIIMIVASIVAGALWAIIPAFFKSIFNTNETLFTLMMNYVAIQLVSQFCIIWENPKGSSTIGVVNSATNAGWLPVLSIGGKDYEYLLNVIVVAVITIAMYIYLKYSKHGYEIAVVGESENTAKYIGINVKKVIIRTMALSGAICGIAGLLLVGGTNHTITTGTAGGRGFTAIMVSWLAKFNPIYMVLTSFIIAFLEVGAGQIATDCGLNESYGDIITGIILFFIIGSEFFINYQIKFHSSKKEVK